MSQQTEPDPDLVSQGFSAGNFEEAYGPDPDDEKLKENNDWLNAWYMGFFASYELHEIPSQARSIYEEAYHSEAGKMCIAAGYCDPRPEFE